MRLDVYLVEQKFVSSRSQAESYIKLGKVEVGGNVVHKAGFIVRPGAEVVLKQDEQFVSRAALKLMSVATILKINFKNQVVLDVGSSTGGFTHFALTRGAKKVIAVDVGTDQLHPLLRSDHRVELHEKTDIRDFKPLEHVDLIVMDVSFVSLRELLPHIATISSKTTQIVAMLKPQFEAGKEQVNKGVIKNDTIRRMILKDFENWAKHDFKIIDKADSDIPGAKGNRERFYLLNKKVLQ